MAVPNSQGERAVSADDVFPSLGFWRERTGDIKLAPSELEHGPVTEDETEVEQGLGTDSIVVIAVLRALDAAGRGAALVGRWSAWSPVIVSI